MNGQRELYVVRSVCSLKCVFRSLSGGVQMKGKAKDNVARYASGRKKPPSQSIAKKTGVNRRFHSIGLSYAGSGTRNSLQRAKAPLRRLSQMSYDIVQMSEKAACSFLSKLGTFGKKWGRTCWACKSVMRPTTRFDTLRCSNASCSAGRPRARA